MPECTQIGAQPITMSATYHSGTNGYWARSQLESRAKVEEQNVRGDRRWRSLLSNDVSQAIEQLVEYPERAVSILRVLNSRLRPLGVRMELIDADRPPPDDAG